MEIALVEAYLVSRTADQHVQARLDEVEALMRRATALDPADACCFRARLADQRAHALNRLGTDEGYRRALALYEALPADDVHPFASYRRDAGLAYGYLRAGRLDEALAAARRACEHAGDGGYVRLRVMGLLMQAKILTRADTSEVLGRAQAIAARLEDQELLLRVARARDLPPRRLPSE